MGGGPSIVYRQEYDGRGDRNNGETQNKKESNNREDETKHCIAHVCACEGVFCFLSFEDRYNASDAPTPIHKPAFLGTIASVFPSTNRTLETYISSRLINQ